MVFTIHDPSPAPYDLLSSPAVGEAEGDEGPWGAGGAHEPGHQVPRPVPWRTRGTAENRRRLQAALGGHIREDWGEGAGECLNYFISPQTSISYTNGFERIVYNTIGIENMERYMVQKEYVYMWNNVEGACTKH